MIEPGGIELSAKEIDRLQQIVAAPEDVEQLIDIAKVSRDEFLSFMDEMGFWDDPEYAKFAGQVLSGLGQREDRKQLAEAEPVDGMRNERRREETRWTSIDWWRQSFGRVVESFVVCCRENLFVRAIMGRTAVRYQPVKVTSTDLWRQLTLPARAKSPFASIGLALVATAAAVVSIGSLMFSLHRPTLERVVSTGANQTTSIRLFDGSLVYLKEDSTVQVSNEEGPTVFTGEAIFQVPHDAPKPLLVRTVIATASASAGAKFRVRIDSRSVEFELFAGVVQVFPSGAHGGTAAIELRKGSRHRIPVHVHGAMAMRARGGVFAKPLMEERSRSTPRDVHEAICH